MLRHHLKIAFHNLRKYKIQNIISILGLSIGFTCFAFSTLWIRYEMSYDNFHTKADRIFRVNTALFKWNTIESSSSESLQKETPYPLANWLKSNFPDIEDACGVRITKPDNFSILYLDNSFCKIFDLSLPENLFLEGSRPAVVTHELNNEETIKVIKKQFDWDVQMSIPRWQANTNILFNVAVPITTRFTEQQLNNWNLRIFDTYILIKDGVDIETLEKKLDNIEVPEWSTPISIVLTPLNQLRYKDPAGSIQTDIKFSHIQIFAIAGLLVILCSLFNYLTLHITRVGIRLPELALRKVNGATNWQINVTLYADFLLIILFSLVVGFILITCLLPKFREYATIGSNNFNIYTELFLYAILLIVFSAFASSIPISYYWKRALNDNIKGIGGLGWRNLLHKGSMLVQLIISLGLIFCSTIFLKQIRFLQYTDLGINRRNIASVHVACCSLSPSYAEQIKQIPGIKDAIPISKSSFLRDMVSSSNTLSYQKEDGETVSCTVFHIYADARFFNFFGVEIIEGVPFLNEYDGKFVLNETAMKESGEFFSKEQKNFAGVVQDFYLTPTERVMPTVIQYPDPKYNILSTIAYKYEENMRQQTEKAVTQWIRYEFPDQGELKPTFIYMDDVFKQYFKSERALFSLLLVMSLACILIAVFGIYSLTSLTCQQRRKDIAIRKINGAEVLDIMNIFFKEYLLLVTLSAFVAFPVGYTIMKRWVQSYVKQTSIDAWLFILIFLIVFFVIIVSIVSIVWKAACQNPAEVMKRK